MILTHGANSLVTATPYGLPFPDGDPLIYNGKTYRTKRIQNLLMQVDFFDEPVASYNVHNGLKYYSVMDRFNIEALVSRMGWRLATDADILYIAGVIELVKQQSGHTYDELLSTQTGWRAEHRGDDLTGLGLVPTGYDYHGSTASTNLGWYSWSGAHSTTGSGAVCFQRWEGGNFSNTSRNWNNSNYLPIVFVKGII